MKSIRALRNERNSLADSEGQPCSVNRGTSTLQPRVRREVEGHGRKEFLRP
jgi:hypothetical protein